MRYKAGFFSKPVVLVYKTRDDWEMAEIKMFESGVWTEYLVEAKSLSAERLVEYERKRDEIRAVAATQERRERLRELGIHLNEE